MLKSIAGLIPAIRNLREERNRYAKELHEARCKLLELELLQQQAVECPNSSHDGCSESAFTASPTIPQLTKSGDVSAQVKQPVFIVGCGRSGTTLLFDLLSQHPQLARTTGYPDGEDHQGWVEHGHCVMAGIGNVYHSQYGNGINGFNYCLHMTSDDATPEVIQGMHAHYWTNVLEENESKRVLNKAPHNSNKIDYVLSIFPDAKIVHIVRDCEAMVASWLAVMGDHPSLVAYWPDEDFPCFWLMPRPTDEVALARIGRHNRFFPGGGEQLWIDYWCKTNGGIAKQMQGNLAQLLVVRYEDVISRPEAVLRRITEFCELPAYSYETGHLEKNTADKHRRLMSSELIAAIDIHSKSVRDQFGYGAIPFSEEVNPQLFCP